MNQRDIELAETIARGIFDEVNGRATPAPAVNHFHLPESVEVPAPQISVTVPLDELVAAIRQAAAEQRPPSVHFDAMPVAAALVEALAPLQEQKVPVVNVDMKPLAAAIDRLAAILEKQQSTKAPAQRPMQIVIERDNFGKLTGCRCIPE